MTEPQTSETISTTIQLTLDVDDITGIATAVTVKTEQTGEISVADILETLSAQGAKDWKVDHNAINDVLKKAKKHLETRIVIARRLDASFSLKLASDNMSATIHVEPAYGGDPLTREDLLAELTENGVDSKRVLGDALQFLISATSATDAIVAEGKPAVAGADSEFIPLVQDDNAPQELEEDEHGRVDFYAGKTYSTVEAGTPILERRPPQAGQVGMDIYGQIIPAEPGKERPFASKMEGTEFASNDPNLVVAKMSGHPVFFDQGVRVDNSLSFETIGLSTGHVTFDGSIEVKGDIMADMRVEATGDIFVKGAVERAKVIAGHNLHIGGGIIGDTSVTVEDGDDLPVLECRLEATGDISVRYVNLASLKAKGNIEIREYAFHSSLSAGGTISLGQNGGKGNLVGGDTVAGHSVTAKLLGNRAYNVTRIRVGLSHDAWIDMQKLRFLREQRLQQARTLRNNLDRLKAKGQEEPLAPKDIQRARKIHDTLLKLQSTIKEIDARMNSLQDSGTNQNEPFVSATQACYPNCDITINGVHLITKQEHRAITFVKRGSAVTAKS
ncbi:DUF342 domain-containing protein [Reinekea blandensis]|uniref:Flagellar Assembly Protein A N-terminal region domain-containing protein n=1 Tax=Reinekea blandensis MED297 TaxID=314283 RepID=A4BBH3_9GAMM|nr:FapA family protein [Reinekea blandensis]EAR10308.1 hypothetical protein MED297_00765 [Reinekea sp. MED297] [Reinekea blandensis MED297]